MRRIVVAGAFDTKSEPLGRLVEALEALGHRPITVDTGVFAGDRACDYPTRQVAEAAGRKSEELPPLGRAAAVNVMAEGARRIVAELCARDELGTLVCMGGSNAGTVFAKLTDVVPIGVPKILMATVAAGETRPLVNASDVILLYPIVDIEGDNGILRGMIARLAAVAVAAMEAGGLAGAGEPSRSVALTMFGVTTACVSQCRTLLAEHGLESFVFHANGSGGKSVERFVAQSLVSSVIDVTITELADELFGGALPAGPERLRTAARRGLPQVIAPGAIDMINFGPLETVPPAFHGRKHLAHNDLVTLIRTTPEENRRLGACTAERLGTPAAPTVVVVPRRGVSALDKEGGPFFDPECTTAFVDGLRSDLSPAVEVIELDLHINDPEFAAALVSHALAGRRAMHLSA